MNQQLVLKQLCRLSLLGALCGLGAVQAYAQAPASATARFTASMVLPAPPFCCAIVMTTDTLAAPSLRCTMPEGRVACERG